MRKQTNLTASQSNYLGSNYFYGLENKEIDKDQAFKCFLKSANMGDHWGMVNLASCYYYGEGVEQNYKQAVHWWEKATNLGNFEAPYNLGLMYLDGTGVEKNYDKAIDFLKLAHERGSIDAEELKELFNGIEFKLYNLVA